MSTITEKETTHLNLPPLLEKHMDFSVWLLNRVKKFHKDLRFMIGSHLAELCLKLMDELINAYYGCKGPARISALQKANVYIEQMRIKIRISYMLGQLPTNAVLYAGRCLKEEAKMIQGWLNTENSHA